MNDQFGWTGRLLNVDLTTGAITVEDTARWFPERIGAIGLGLSLIWERVPAGTLAFDPQNLFFIGAGTLTGTWVPCAGRAIAVSLSPGAYPVEQVAQGSVGGHWPTELKRAGFDGISITGRATTPQFLFVHDGSASLLDASHLWGQDTFSAQRAIRQAVNDEQVKTLVIGPAGEKLARNAAVLHGTGHALGQCGFGAVLGSKLIKGIAVRGTSYVKTWTSLDEYYSRLDDIRRLLALMQSVMPADVDSRSRWRAREGLEWAGGDEVVPIGPIPPQDLARQGLRHCGSDFYAGGTLLPWHVKNSGCAGCVMNCFSTIRARDIPEEIPAHGEVHCVQTLTAFFTRRREDVVVAKASPETCWTGKQLADMIGINSYDLRMLFPLVVQLRFGADGSYLEQQDPHIQEEILALPWESIDADGDGGLAFHQAVLTAMRDADPQEDNLGGILLRGTPRAAARFEILEDLWTGANGQFAGFEGFTVRYAAHGNRDHYGPDRYGLPAGLHWAIWNRDPNRHEHNGLVSWSGLTWQQKRRVAEIHFGDPNVINDPNQQWQPGLPTPARIELARLLTLRSMLKDSLGLCDWVYPNYCCPDPDREYAGDLGLEAELYRAITGDQLSAEELDMRAEALVDLYRAITMRNWNTTDMRGGPGYTGGGQGHDQGGDYRGHDNLAAWYFQIDVDTPRLNRDDFEQAKTLFYQRFGWHAQLGCVTSEKLTALGQGDVADGLDALGLLPE